MALHESVVREQNERIHTLVQTPTFLVVAGSLTGLGAATSVDFGMAIGAVSALAMIIMALIARPLRSVTGVFARIPVLLLVSATVVTLLSFAVRVINPVAWDGLGIYLPLAAVNGLVACFIFDDSYTASPVSKSTFGTAVVGAIFTFLALTFIGFINGMFTTGEVFGLVNGDLAASPISIFGKPAGSLFLLALVAVFVQSIVAAVAAGKSDAKEGSEQ